ncbi:MAG: hypothetical protein ACE5K0_07455 [Candidatus Methanofastidiosia archaeon]
MKLIPLSFDSLGVRSMATFVKTKKINILIDPSAALGPKRYGLPPHILEVKRLSDHWRKIKKFVKKSDVLIVTHYHFDHHNPKEVELYKDKRVFLKHPKENINKSQLKRSKYFIERLGELPKSIDYSDFEEFSFSSTTIKFSKAVPHGFDARLGYVTQVCICEDSKFIHTSDVEGFPLREQTEFILSENPDTLILDGPMGFFTSEMRENIKKVMDETKIKKFIIDHHFLRDLRWKEKLKDFYEFAKGRCEILSVAEFCGVENDLLEAKRKQLYRELEKEV